MSGQNETLAEIVAEMRKRMKSYYYSREGRNLMRQYADRIEAVARRETAAAWIEGYNHANTEKSSAVDNSAAMREALTKVSEWMVHRIATCGFEASPTFPTVLEDVVLPALAAPPRNCDIVPIEAPEAADMFHKERPGHGYDYETHDWLLAPANERGENDGSK